MIQRQQYRCVSSRTDPDDDVVDVTSFSALDVVKINYQSPPLKYRNKLSLKHRTLYSNEF